MTRHTLWLTAALAAVTIAPGCRALGTGGGTGAAIGTAVGAGAGYAIGEHNDDKWAGTAIGALAGGLAGWMIGDSVEPQTHEVPLEGPAVHRTDRSRAPALPGDECVPRDGRRTETIRVPRGTERVIVRDIYPDGRIVERTIPLD